MHESKYKIGDTAWMIEYEKAIAVTITGVLSLWQDGKFSGYKYYLKQESDTSAYGWITEEKLHASKEDLINSL
jgi:hypothetical protein